MSDYERKKIDLELRAFATKYLKKPSECNDAAQIGFCVSELAKKIEMLERSCNYAPPWAYTMLAQYSAKYSSLLYKEFTNSYS